MTSLAEEETPSQGWTKEDDNALQKLKETLGKELTEGPHAEFPEVTGDYFLLRILRSHKHDIDAAAEMYRKHLKLRVEFGLNEIREKLTYPLYTYQQEDVHHGKEVSKYWYAGYNMGFTPNEGHVITYHELVRNDTRQMYSKLGADIFREYELRALIRRQIQMESLSQRDKKMVQLVALVNCEGVGLRNVTHFEHQSKQMELKELRETMPNILHRAYVFPLSYIVRQGYYGIVQYLLPKENRPKVKLLGGDYKGTLAERVGLVTLQKVLTNHEDTSSANTGDNAMSLTKDLKLKAGATKDITIPFDTKAFTKLSWEITPTTNDIVYSISLYKSDILSNSNDKESCNDGDDSHHQRTSSSAWEMVLQKPTKTDKSVQGSLKSQDYTKSNQILVVFTFSNEHSWFNLNSVNLKIEKEAAS
eukprot:g580.t1